MRVPPNHPFPDGDFPLDKPSRGGTPIQPPALVASERGCRRPLQNGRWKKTNTAWPASAVRTCSGPVERRGSAKNDMYYMCIYIYSLNTYIYIYIHTYLYTYSHIHVYILYRYILHTHDVCVYIYIYVHTHSA